MSPTPNISHSSKRFDEASRQNSEPQQVSFAANYTSSTDLSSEYFTTPFIKPAKSALVNENSDLILKQIDKSLSEYNKREALSRTFKTFFFGGLTALTVPIALVSAGQAISAATALAGVAIISHFLKLGHKNDLKIERLGEASHLLERDDTTRSINKIACELAAKMNIPAPSFTIAFSKDEAISAMVPDSTQVIFGHSKYCLQIDSQFLKTKNHDVQSAVIAHELAHIADNWSFKKRIARFCSEGTQIFGTLFPAAGIGSLVFRCLETFQNASELLCFASGGACAVATFITLKVLGLAWHLYEQRICEYRMDLQGVLATKSAAGTLQALQMIKEEEKENSPRTFAKTFFSEHPPTTARIENIHRSLEAR